MRPSRSEYGALISLATPIVIVQVGLMTMGVVDAIMVGRFSPEALAATAIGNFYFFVVAVFGMGVLLVLDPLIAQAVGARDETGIALAVQRGLLLALALSVVLGALMLPAEGVLRALRQPDELVPLSARYVLICLPSLLPFTAFLVFRQLLQALGLTRAIVATIVLCNLANVALNWALIFGNLGLPRLGVTGAALATSISRTLLVLVLVALAWRRLRPYVRPLRRQALERAPLARMLRLGLPIGAQHELEVSYFGGLILLMGLLGTISVAAHQAAINLASLTFMVPVGVGSATAVFVGGRAGGAPVRGRRTGVWCGIHVRRGGGVPALSALAGGALLARPGSSSARRGADTDRGAVPGVRRNAGRLGGNSARDRRHALSHDRGRARLLARRLAAEPAARVHRAARRGGSVVGLAGSADGGRGFAITQSANASPAQHGASDHRRQPAASSQQLAAS
ncbi:MAG: MATE family efflux transporter, partial [Gemmatimonadaceae bacterium]